MKAIKILGQRWLLSLIGVSIVTLLLGGWGQYVSLAHYQPFGSALAKGLVIGLLWLIFALCYLQLRPKAVPIAELQSAKASAQDSLQLFSQAFRRFITEIKPHVKQGKVPTLLVLGAENSGTTSLLRHAELVLEGKQTLINANLMSAYLEPKLSEDALFLVAAKQFASEQSAVEQDWQKLATLLKQQLTKRSLQAVVITYSLTELLQQTDEQLLVQSQTWRQRVSVLQDALGYYLPIYIVMTQVDRLTGFKAFFANLGVLEKQQAWGVRLQASTDFVKNYQGLLTQLNQRVLQRLHQIADEQQRILAADFPLQMTAIQARLAQLVQNLGQPHKYTYQLTLSGLYFTSALQQGEQVDYLLGDLAAQFDLQQPTLTQTVNCPEAYFIKHLWRQLLLPDNSTVLLTKQTVARQQHWVRACYMLVGLAFVIAGLTLYASYRTNKQQLTSLTDGLERYQQLAKTGNADAAIQQLEQIANQLAKQRNWLNTVGFEQANKAASTYDVVYQQQLQRILLPALLAVLEQNLQDNLQHPSLLYRTLKAYLMFAEPAHMQASFVQDWFAHFLYQGFGNTVPQTAILQNAVASLLANPLPAQTLNNSLIAKARQVLNTITPVQRAYNTIQQQDVVNKLPTFNLDNTSISGFEQLFAINKVTAKIPGFYTTAGYEQVYAKLDKVAVQETRADHWMLGDETTAANSLPALNEQIQNSYFTDYLAYWGSTLNQVKLRQFANLNQAVDAVKILAGPSSPMQQLLHLVVQNTYLAAAPTKNGQAFNAVVSPYFAVVRQFVQADPQQPVSMLHMQQQLQAVHSYLLALLNTPNLPQACFTAAHALIKQDATNPLVILQQQAEQYPQPVRAWVNGLISQIAGLLMSEAQQYLNQQWQQQVYLPYSQSIQYHYPFGLPSQTEVTLTDFTAFFGPHGIWAKFMANYLQDFIKTDAAAWQVRRFAGQSLAISQSSLAVLQQANQVSQLFFNTDGKISVIFTLKPVDMSSELADAQLYVAKQQLSYRHDPQLPMQLNWPTDKRRINLQFISLNGERKNLSFTGEWALFKWLKSCKMQPQSATQYFVTCSMAGHAIRYSLQADSIHNPFNQLNNLMLWSLPDNIH